MTLLRSSAGPDRPMLRCAIDPPYAPVRRLAATTEELLRGEGLVVPAAAVDELVNDRVEAVARVLGVSPRSPLAHAPDRLPHALLADVRTVARPGPRAGLRVVRD